MKTNYIILLLMVPFFISAVTKTTINNGNWNNAAIWSPSGVPGTNDKIYINHVVNLNQNFTVSDTVFVRNTLNINNNRILTLNPGTMVLVNNPTYNGRLGTIGSNGKILGNFIFQKWVTRCDGNSTYGSPFDVLASDFDWYHCFQCMGPTWSNIYFYNETVGGNLENGYYDNFGNNIYRGKGFFYWFSNYVGGQNFPRQIALKGSVDLTTAFDFNVTKTTSGGFSNDGYNLVANPFPGTIDWTAGSWTKTNILNAIYTWNSCTDSYSTYIFGIGINGGTKYIPSMQGFWVQAYGNNPVLKVTSAALATTAQNLLRSNFNNDSVNKGLRLDLNGDEIAIHLDSLATNHLDPLMDAPKFFSGSSAIYSTMNGDSVKYAINSLKDTSTIVHVSTKGSGALNFNGLTTFLNQYSIVLKDNVTNTFTTVTEGMQYNFTDSTLVTFNDRFEIHFIKNLVTTLHTHLLQQPRVVSNNETITVYMPQEFEIPFKLQVSDLMGKIIFTGNYNESIIIVPKPPVPIILNIVNSQQAYSKKIF